MKRHAIVSNIRVGKPAISPSAPSHTWRVREGNAPREWGGEPGNKFEKDRVRATARRSTGIRPSKRNPIDPRMPVITPA